MAFKLTSVFCARKAIPHSWSIPQISSAGSGFSRDAFATRAMPHSCVNRLNPIILMSSGFSIGIWKESSGVVTFVFHNVEWTHNRTVYNYIKCHTSTSIMDALIINLHQNSSYWDGKLDYLPSIFVCFDWNFHILNIYLSFWEFLGHKYQQWDIAILINRSDWPVSPARPYSNYPVKCLDTPG